MRWVFCLVTIQQINSGEETFDISDYTPVYFTEYASPSPPSHFQWRDRGQNMKRGPPIASYALSTFRSEERRKKKKMEMRGWKKENCSLQPRSLCAWNKLREHLTSSSHITEQTSGFFALLKCRIKYIFTLSGKTSYPLGRTRVKCETRENPRFQC